jgi:hypothetical protein
MFLPLAALAVLAVAIVAFAGTVGNNAGFEDDDGNLIDNSGNSLIDWNTFDPVLWQPSPTLTPTREADKTSNGFTFKGIEDWQATTSDSGFAGGTKQDDECATVGTAKAPNKDDLKRIYLATTTKDVVVSPGVTESHTFLELAWVRIPQNTTSPSAHIAFEFNKDEKGTCDEPGGLATRSVGDMLIVYDFEGGASDTPRLTLRRWVDSGACEVGSSSPPCWGPATDLTASGVAEAKVNTTSTVVDDLTPPALNDADGESVTSTLGLNEFGEAGIDLTDADVFGPGQCEGFGTAFGVSRSSGNSATAQMKDIVGPADFTLANCGQITIIKRTAPRGVDQNFGFTSTIAGAELDCSPDTTPAGFTLNDDAGVDTTALGGNTETCTNVPAGSYTVTEGANPSGFDFTSLVCTATGGASGAQDGTIAKQANITMVPNGTVTCVYTNTQQLGAIQVTKTRKHAATPLNSAHSGVTFTVKQGTTTVATGVTDSNGKACFGSLPFGSYTVTETVPAGYSVDANDKLVTVDNSAACADDPFGGETVSFHNTPLTDLTVTVNSDVDGGTGSTINCVDGATPPNSVASGTIPATAPDNGDGSATAPNLVPGTYTCTVVIDP